MDNHPTEHHEKYDSKNPIAQKLIQGFMDTIKSLTDEIKIEINQVTECGCGQGHVNQLLESIYPDARIRGLDINDNDLELANQNKHNPHTLLYNKSIYDIDETEAADLVVCCEVLEHLEHPNLGLEKMAALKAPYYLFSVPNEPLWRILNFMRGKYWRDWGNTPDHVNHWSSRKFKRFVEQHLEVVELRKPLPWNMVLAKSR